ncbi:MAG: MFS transporter [Acidobacteriota bacterium]
MEEQRPARPARDLKTTGWVNSTYFAEGFPYVIVIYMFTVFYTDLGVKERYLGYLNFFALAWNIKFLWAPFVDMYSTKRRWLLVIEAVLSVGLAAVAVLAIRAIGVEGSAPPHVLEIIAFVGAALAFASATHDIAIDGYYLTALTDKDEQARYTGDRVMSYRMAIIYGRSVLVAAAAVIGWVWSWAIAAATMTLIFLFHSWFLPQPEHPAGSQPPGQRAAGSQFLLAFRTYLAQPRVILMLAFVMMYKLGDNIMFSMRTAFLMRYLGVSMGQLSWLAGILGTGGSIAGSLLSAWLISKLGLKRAIWPLTLMMNLNIWAYIGLAYWKPDPATVGGLTWIAIIHAYEEWAGGMGNATLLIYLMRTCRPEFKAAHYAVGSAVMSVGLTVVGGFGGVIVEHVGYVGLFMLAFFASIPSMIMIPWIPHLDERR